MRCYKLLKDNKFYNEDNIKEFDMNKLKNAVGIQVSSLGAMGAGGLIYVITKNEEEILFDYFSSTKEGNIVHFENSPVFNIVKEYLPIIDGVSNEEWELLDNGAGWSFYVRKDYLEKFHKKYKEIGETNEHFEIYIHHLGPDILLKAIKE